MSNNSSVSSLYDGTDTFWVYVIWFIQGATMAISNLLIAAAILRYKALRKTKEYVVVLGLALADFTNMLGYALAGIRRPILIIDDQYGKLKSQWDCMLVSHVIVWSFGEHWSGLALVAVSLDRIISLAVPTKYHNFTHRYAIILVSITLGYTCLTGLVPGFVFSLIHKDQLNPVHAGCYAGEVLGSAIGQGWYRIYFRWFTIVCAVVSIIMYGVVWWLFKRSQNNTVAPTDVHNDFKRKLAVRVTTTLGISCLCTLFVYAIPSAIHSIGVYYNLSSNFTQPWFILSNCNSFCNLFIYVLRHKEMKMAIYGLFTNKTMPLNLQAWKKNVTAKTFLQKQSAGTGLRHHGTK